MIRITIYLFVFFLILPAGNPRAQGMYDVTGLPVNVVTAVSDSSKPFVIYVTGDGGWNKFSQHLSGEFAAQGYPVVALNALKYFWKQKTSLQAAKDVTRLILYYQRIFKKEKFLLVGYSFGADVMPFIYNHLNKLQSSLVTGIYLLSPSANTDFEIHLMGMLGHDSDGESVPAAINRIADKPIIFIFGQEENEFPLKELSIFNYKTYRLAGGHHYDGDERSVVNTILR